MKMDELKVQEMLAKSLNIEFERFDLNAKAYYGNEFKNSIGKYWGKKPDLVLFHNLKIRHPTKNAQVLQSPIGLEFKNGEKFNEITIGVLDQIKGRYLPEEYYLSEDKNTVFRLGSLAFATTTSCQTGIIYQKNFPDASNFFIERFCWRADVAVLMKFKGEFVFSFVNYLFGLDGKIKGRYAEQGAVLCD
jgi:hypothetical protein